MRTSPLLLSILAALACESHHTEACMFVPAGAMTCPPGKDVKPEQLFLNGECGVDIDDVDSDGTLKPLGGETASEELACCYTVMVTDNEPLSDCAVGRPYHEGAVALRAPVRSSTAGSASDRALAWERAGAEEHASVAAFTRLALQLMAHGAPSELLRDVHRAALDEIGHAERCWSLSRQLGGGAAAADRFPFTEPVAVDVTLAKLAADAVREGCLGETLGAHLATVAAELAPEPDIRAELSAIAAEEAEHAVLSFRIVAWALRTGGSAVHTAVRSAFDAPWPKPDLAELAVRANVAESVLRTAAADGIRNVLEPARDRLLAA